MASAHADHHEQASGTLDESSVKSMMELGMPSAHHKVLDALIGEWNYTISYKMAPDAPEQKSIGKSSNKWVMDGRFVQQDISGTMDMGDASQKFEGLGFIGHDNVKGTYVSSWIDNITTGIMTATGTYNMKTKTITENGTFSCPMIGGEKKFKSELTFVDADTFTYTMYDTTGDTQFKSMDITYNRKK